MQKGRERSLLIKDTVHKTGRQQKTDRSCCGVLIKGVDRDKWMSKIAVPLEMSTAMAAEVVGASGVTRILDLVLGKKPQYGSH